MEGRTRTAGPPGTRKGSGARRKSGGTSTLPPRRGPTRPAAGVSRRTGGVPLPRLPWTGMVVAILGCLSVIGTERAAAQDAPSVVVGLTAVESDGGLQGPEAFPVVQEGLAELAACVRRRPDDAVPERATLVLRLSVGAAGDVKAAEVARTTDPDDGADRCAAQSASAWRFPAREASSVVTATFLFGTRPDVDAETVEAVVRRHMHEVRTCALRARASRMSRLTLELEVDRSGRVQHARVDDGDAALDDVAEGCICVAAMRWRFPLSQREDVLRIRYPLVLGRVDQYTSRSRPKTTSPP